MKKFLTIAIIFILQPLYAGWSDHGLSLISTAESGIEDYIKYELRDNKGRVFYVNSPKEPDSASMKKITKYKDDVFSWKHIAVKELSFYIYEKSIQAMVIPSSVRYRDTDIKPYLPSGFYFIEGEEGFNYRFRIMVKNTSLKLDGRYAGEEQMLEEMHAYIRGISKGEIIVEDERVISGSVVSFTSEKESGDRSIHPVGDLPEHEKDIRGKSKAGWGKLKKYLSAQGSYLFPAGFWGDIYLGGYGFTVSAGICDLGFSVRNRTIFRFEFELTTGFWYLNKRKQVEEYADRSIDNAYIIPVGITGRYPIGIAKKLFIAPSVSFGYYYNKLEYNILSKEGAVETVSVNEWTPSVMLGFMFSYRFDKIFAFAGADLLTMFERRLDIASLLFNTGCGYMF